MTIGGLTITQDNCCTKTVAEVYIKLPREELGGKSILEVAESGKQAVYIGTSHAATERNVIREYLRFLVDTHERNVAVIQKDMNYKRTSAAAAAATTNNNNPRATVRLETYRGIWSFSPPSSLRTFSKTIPTWLS